MTSNDTYLYKIIFISQSKYYEIYAKAVNQAPMYGFVEISDITFSQDHLVVDPAEEKLKDEFNAVKSTYIPTHSVIRIDYVKKRGSTKIRDASKEDKVTYFPTETHTPPKQ